MPKEEEHKENILDISRFANLGEKLSGKKAFIFLFMLNFFILAIIYSLYTLNLHFSPDAYIAVVSPETPISAHNSFGRVVSVFVSWLLFSVFSFSITSETFMFCINVLYLAVCSLFLTSITISISKRFATTTLFNVAIVNFAALLFFVNPCFVAGLISFPEALPAACAGVFLVYLAYSLWLKEGLAFKIAAFVALSFAINAYSLYFEYFFPVALIYILVSTKFAFSKETLIQVLKLIAFALLAVVVATLISKAYAAIVGITLRKYGSITLDPEVIWSNLKAVLDSQPQIFVSMETLSYSFLFPAICLVPLILIIVLNLMNLKAKRPSIIVGILGLFAIWLTAFIAQIVNSQIWLAQRTYAAIWLLPLILYAFLICCFDANKNEPDHNKSRFNVLPVLKVLTCLFLGVFVVLCSANVIEIQTSTLINDANDARDVKEINNAIKSYEAETGINVTHIEILNDSTYHFTTGVKFSRRDTNMTALRIPWAFPGLFKYVNQRDVEVSTMSDEKYKELFGDGAWNLLDPEEQIRFDGDTAYVAIY